MATSKILKFLFYFWPGAGGVLRQGRWSFLTIALAYGFAVCGIVAANFYWSEMLTGFFRTFSCIAMFVLWLILSGKSAAIEKKCHKMRCPPSPEKDGLLDAQHHYLQGNWFEAECCLTMLLKNNPRDIEAMLMLATLYRHKDRYDEAARLLRELVLLEDAAVWKPEIRSEKRKLIASVAKNAKKSNEPAKSKQTDKNSERHEEFNDDNENNSVSEHRQAA